MRAPYVDGLEWGFQQTYLSATRMLRSEGRFRPYLQVRGGLARLHPQPPLRRAAPPRGFLARKQLDAGCQRVQLQRHPGPRVEPQPRGRLRPVGSVRPFRRRRLRPQSRRPSAGELGFDVRGPLRRALASRQRRSLGTPPECAGRWAARRLGCGEELRLGWGGGGRDQLGSGRLQRVHPQRQLQPDQPAELVAQHHGRLHVRRQRFPHEPVPPLVQRQYLLQLRPGERPRILDVVCLRGVRRLHVGGLRRDAPDVLQRPHRDELRRIHDGRDDVPPLVGDPEQPGDGCDTRLQRGRVVRHRSHPRREPPRLGPQRRLIRSPWTGGRPTAAPCSVWV